MTLSEFLKGKDTKEVEAFAGRIGVLHNSLYRYCRGRIPEPKVVIAIYKETEGSVQPNDFYPLAVDGLPLPSAPEAKSEAEEAKPKRKRPAKKARPKSKPKLKAKAKRPAKKKSKPSRKKK